MLAHSLSLATDGEREAIADVTISIQCALTIGTVSVVKSINTKAWVALVGLGLVMALLLFVPAGTLHYWQAWVYLSIFMGASALITLYLMKRDPALLRRRMSGGPLAEERPAQNSSCCVHRLAFVALLVVPGLDPSPPVVCRAARRRRCRRRAGAIGFYLIARVYRENTFTLATIELADDQKVISTGPYAIVRHPMYASASLYLFGTPLALGSYWAFVAIGAMMPFLIWRLLDEERFLAETLAGYPEYQQRVRHRLVPFVW